MKKLTYFFIIVGFLSLSLITSFTYTYGENLQSFLMNSTIIEINRLEPFYVATTIDCLNSKELKSHLYIIVEDICIEKATIKE